MAYTGMATVPACAGHAATGLCTSHAVLQQAQMQALPKDPKAALINRIMLQDTASLVTRHGLGRHAIPCRPACDVSAMCQPCTSECDVPAMRMPYAALHAMCQPCTCRMEPCNMACDVPALRMPHAGRARSRSRSPRASVSRSTHDSDSDASDAPGATHIQVRPKACLSVEHHTYGQLHITISCTIPLTPMHPQPLHGSCLYALHATACSQDQRRWLDMHDFNGSISAVSIGERCCHQGQKLVSRAPSRASWPPGLKGDTCAFSELSVKDLDCSM